VLDKPVLSRPLAAAQEALRAELLG
jgi:hypothetical protein